MHDNIICFNPSSLHLFKEAVTFRKKREHSGDVPDYSKEEHNGSVGRLEIKGFLVREPHLRWCCVL